MRSWIWAFLSQNISKLGHRICKFFSLGHGQYFSFLLSHSPFHLHFFKVWHDTFFKHRFQGKNDCLRLLMAATLSLTMPSCFLLSFTSFQLYHHQLYFILKTSKNCVESAASFLGRVVIPKKNIRKTLNIYFLSTQKTTIGPYTQTKFSRNATVLCLLLLKGRAQITRAAFKNWTEHSVQHCHICDRI